MLKKFYEKGKDFIISEYKFIIFLVVFCTFCLWPVNYYIVIGGGISDIGERVIVEDGYDSNGSFNLSYVSELKGTTLSYLISYVMPHWERVNMNDYKYTDDEDYQDIEFRSELDLLASNSNALYYAYQLADKPCKVTNTDVYVIAIFEGYDNPLQVGDELLKVDGISYSNVSDFQQAIQDVEGSQVEITVLRDAEEVNLECHLYEEEDRKLLGVGLQSVSTYETDPEVKFEFQSNESGPSAGLITTLSIYDQLTEGDLTDGKLIAGTGTIEADGSIGEIGEVEYKLLGAVDGGADIFLVPDGENYEDCKKMKQEEDLDIQLISVTDIYDAVEKLESLD